MGHPSVSEAAAIGVPDEIKGEKLICFCVLTSVAAVGPALESELKDRVAQAMGHALKPAAVEFIDALPKTRNGKVMRRVIRATYLGQDPGDVSALEQKP